MNHIAISKDGTRIAYQTSGQGPALILIDGFLGWRDFGPLSALVDSLAKHFTVYTYDRRGRGKSTDSQTYAIEREIEDIAALLEVAGGSAVAFGISSGGMLALRAAASLPNLHKIAMYEIPINDSLAGHSLAEYYSIRLAGALVENDYISALGAFLLLNDTSYKTTKELKQSPAWADIQVATPTLAYDNAILGGNNKLPLDLASHIVTPALLIASSKSPAHITSTARSLAAVMPNGVYRNLKGEGSQQIAEAIAPVLTEFLTPAS